MRRRLLFCALALDLLCGLVAAIVIHPMTEASAAPLTDSTEERAWVALGKDECVLMVRRGPGNWAIDAGTTATSCASISQ